MRPPSPTTDTRENRMPSWASIAALLGTAVLRGPEPAYTYAAHTTPAIRTATPTKMIASYLRLDRPAESTTLLNTLDMLMCTPPGAPGPRPLGRGPE